ncbi:MAG: hypothetical protein QXL67_04975 [Candidatus Bathyarchaeia archaeon]
MGKGDKQKKAHIKEHKRLWLATFTIIVTVSTLILGYYLLIHKSEGYSSIGGGYDIGILDQFYSQNPRFSDEVTSLASSLGLKVYVHKDENITVGLYKKLPTFGYKLIILRVHAGVCEKLSYHPTFLFTSERYTTSKYIVEQLSDLIMSGVIDPENPVNPVFTVGPDFIESSEGSYNGATVILSSCLGLYNKHLAEAFLNKGAKVFISWDEKVSLRHTDEGVLLLLRRLLLDKMTVEEAVISVMNEVGSDPNFGGKLGYYPLEEGELKLDLR